jgi:hypothetical protein
MPNWCNNVLTITGDKVQLDKIKYLLEESAKEERGMFITLVGIPEGITPEEHDKDWWDIHISYWGCKWDVDYEEHSASYYDDNMTLCFETAWSPPIGFCEKLAQYFSVKVENFYSEPGVGFAGLCTCYPDGTAEDDELDYMEGMYKYDNEGFWCDVESNIENQIEEIDWDDNPGIDEIIENTLSEFNYINGEDIEKIKDLITQTIQDYGEA